jgi:hypothetical protein
VSATTTAALIRSWQGTLDHIESGEASPDEIEFVRCQLSHAVDDGIARLKNGANKKDERELIRVVSLVNKALERVLARRRLR